MRPLLAATVALLLAGCSSPPVTEDAAAPPVPAVPAGAEVHVLRGTSTAVAGARHLPEQPILAFNTTAGVRAIVVELAWDDAVQDLDSFVQADVEHCDLGSRPLEQATNLAFCTFEDAFFGYPGFGAYRNGDGALGEPDNPSRFIVADEELAAVMERCGDPCPWTGWPESRGPSVQVAWAMHVTVFYGDMPLDYSALPA